MGLRLGSPFDKLRVPSEVEGEPRPPAKPSRRDDLVSASGVSDRQAAPIGDRRCLGCGLSSVRKYTDSAPASSAHEPGSFAKTAGVTCPGAETAGAGTDVTGT